MQGDEVGAGQQLIELDLFDAELLGALGRQEGIVGHDLHLQAKRPVGDDAADVAGADQAQRLGVELDAHEAVLLPLAGLGGGVGGGHLAGQREHHGDGVLGGGDRVAEGGVHHHDPSGGGGWDVDVVDADAGAADDLEARGRGDDVLVGLGVGADDQAVVIADHGDQLVFREAGLDVGVDAALAEDLDGGGAEGVGDEDAGHGWIPVNFDPLVPAKAGIQMAGRDAGSMSAGIVQSASEFRDLDPGLRRDERN